MSVALCIAFMLVHADMFLLFRRYQVTPMIRFNIFSVVFYCVVPLLVFLEKHALFVRLVYLEVAAHMTAVTYFVGWDSDFQIALIGLPLLAACAEMIARRLRITNFRGAYFYLLTMCLYLGSCVINHYHEVRYVLPAEVSFHLRIAWAVIVFAFTIFFYQLFAHLLFRSRALLADQVLHDSLTGLPNRYDMTEKLEAVMERQDAKQHWLAIADLDGFKQVNDVYGHNCGDYVLKASAGILRENRINAEVCRWGGEEFLLMGRMDTDIRGTCEKLNGLRKRVEAYTFLYERQRMNLTITIGVTPYEAGDSVETWVNRADMNLYKGKCSGKNMVVSESRKAFTGGNQDSVLVKYTS